MRVEMHTAVYLYFLVTVQFLAALVISISCYFIVPKHFKGSS